MRFPRTTVTSSMATIKSYVYLLIGSALIMSVIIGSYLYWQTAVSRQTEEAASQYHLTTILHTVQAKEILHHMMAHRTYDRLSLYEPGQYLDFDYFPEYGASYNAITDVSLVETHLETIVALQNLYAHPEFAITVHTIEEHLNLLQRNDIDTRIEDDLPTTNEVSQILITLEQLEQLHVIAHKELLADQISQSQQNNINMLFLLGGIVIAGLIINYIVLRLIGRTLAQQERDEAKVRRRNKELATFNAIAATVNQSPKLDVVLSTALNEIEKERGLKHSEIWLLDEETGRLSPGIHRGLAEDFALQVSSWQIGEGVPGIVAETNHPLLIENLTTNPQFLREGGGQYKFHTVLGIPLMSQEKLMGVMNFFTHKLNRFSPELVESLTTIGYLLGTAIENSHLFTAVQQELTERIQAEEALRESQNLFTSVTEQSQEGIGVANTDGNYVLVNPAFSHMTGYSREELLSMNVRDLLPPKVELKLFPKVVSEQSGVRISQLQRKDGSIFYAEISGSPIITESEPLVLGVVRDITERMQMEEERSTQLQHLEDIDQIDRTIQQASDLEKMMSDVLELILDIFDCDRAWLIYPCDPDIPCWHVPMERTRPKYPGALIVGDEIPMQPDAAKIFQTALDSTQPVCYDPETERRLDASAKLFSVQSQMITAVYPKTDKPWLLGIHQCTHARVWTKNDQRLFQEIGHRIADALSSLLFLRNLQESELRYRLLFENSPLGIASIDINGNILAANPTTIEMMGSPSVEATKEINFLTFPLLVKAGLSADLQRCIDTGEVVSAERYYTSKWGRAVCFHHQMIPIRDADDQIVGAQVILEDIIERKNAEAEITRLATVIEQAADAIYITDLDGNISYANQAVETMTGFSSVELLGQTSRLFQSGHHDLSFYEQLWDTITGGETWRGEFVNNHKNGDIYYEEAAIFPIKDDSGQIINYAAVKRDITHEKEREIRAREQDRLAAVGQLAAGIAHDFNNIMAVIVLYSQLTLREPDLPAEMHKRMQMIEQQALQASDLTQQILDFSRQAVLTRQQMLLIPFLKEIFKLLKRTLPENISLNLLFSKDEYVIYADPTRIQQAIMNLALNARDAMPDGGEFRVILARLDVKEDDKRPFPNMAPGDWVQIIISDTGTGISDEVLSNIFAPFYTTKAPGKGSGLGLAQVQGIVKQHDGHVEVTTKVNAGTAFTLYLPALPQSAPEKIPPKGTDDLHQGNGETILLVEDNPATREALVAILELFNYHVLTAINGQDGLEQYHAHKDEIVLLISDVIMPGMGGVDLLHALRGEGETIPIIMLSGHPKHLGIDLLPAQGYVDWLLKPPQLPQLGRAVSRAIQQ